MILTYRGGLLDGRVANVPERTTRLEIPLYGHGYARPATGTLVYVRVGRILVARRT